MGGFILKVASNTGPDSPKNDETMDIAAQIMPLSPEATVQGQHSSISKGDDSLIDLADPEKTSISNSKAHQSPPSQVLSQLSAKLPVKTSSGIRNDLETSNPSKYRK